MPKSKKETLQTLLYKDCKAADKKNTGLLSIVTLSKIFNKHGENYEPADILELALECDASAGKSMVYYEELISSIYEEDLDDE